MLVVFAVLAAGFSAAQAYHGQCSPDVRSEWDFFVFVELSPGADCYTINGSLNCSWFASPNWTMHGMWPTTTDSKECPAYCNNSAKFNITEIEDLLPQLMRVWPTLANPNPKKWDKQCLHVNKSQYMWCHEWVKHGTCATGIPELSSQHGFFSTVLRLFETRMNYDTFVLAKHGVIPSLTHRYQMGDFASAFEAEWGDGIHPVLMCDWKDGDHVLESIRTCLKRDFTPMRCPEEVYKERTCKSNPILYLPS